MGKKLVVAIVIVTKTTKKNYEQGRDKKEDEVMKGEMKLEERVVVLVVV